MNRDQTNDRWPVMQHFGTGGDVQYKLIDEGTDGWQDCPMPSWNWDKYDYRKTPKPRKFWIVEWPTRLEAYDSAHDATNSASQRFCNSIGRIIPVTESGL